MTVDERAAFVDRAAKVFGVSLPRSAGAGSGLPMLPERAGAADDGGVAGCLLSPGDPTDPAPASGNCAPPVTGLLPLIVAVVADASDGATIRPLIRDVARLQATAVDPRCAVHLLVLANGGARPSESSAPLPLFLAVAQEAVSGGLLAAVVTPSDAERDASSGFLPPDAHTASAVSAASTGARLGIAPARTLLQRYAYALAADITASLGDVPPCLSPAVLILDDDKSFHPLTASPGSPALAPTWRGDALLRAALHARATTGAAAVVGADTGAPPLPVLSAVRLQLVDVLALVTAAAEADGPESPLAP
jgi:hypothetical protein